MAKHSEWKITEVSLVRQHYAILGAKELAVMLNKSASAVHQMAFKLGIKKYKLSTSKQRSLQTQTIVDNYLDV